MLVYLTKYRDNIKIAPGSEHNLRVHIVYDLAYIKYLHSG